MSCNCQTISVTSPSGETLPTVADVCAIEKPTSICKTCYANDEALQSDSSDGTTLTSTWLDSGCYNDDVTILGRVGNKLARFTGSGFIKLTNGIASVVTSVPLQAKTLWHNWWKSSNAQPPVLGAPLPVSYDVVADSEGNLHAQRGTDTEDSIKVWDATTKEFTQTPISEIDKSQKGLLPRASQLELVGYAAIADGGSAEEVRPLKSLEGDGILLSIQQDTIDPDCECAPAESKASVVRMLAPPVPDADEVYTLKYSTALGYHWSEDV